MPEVCRNVGATVMYAFFNKMFHTQLTETFISFFHTKFWTAGYISFKFSIIKLKNVILMLNNNDIKITYTSLKYHPLHKISQVYIQ
jgi:hypothetical protein